METFILWEIFYVPRKRTEFLRRFPYYWILSTAWNLLSSELKEIAQKYIFKQTLKAKLLDNLKDVKNCFEIFAPPLNS